jgi:hypothetical protein
MGSVIAEWKDLKERAKKVGFDVSGFKDDLSGTYRRVGKEAERLTAALKAYDSEMALVAKTAAKYGKLAESLAAEHKNEKGAKLAVAKDMVALCGALENWGNRGLQLSKPPSPGDWREAKARARKAGLDLSPFKDDFADTCTRALKKGAELTQSRKDCISELDDFINVVDKYHKICVGFVKETPADGPRPKTLRGAVAREIAAWCSEMASWAQQARRGLR